MPIVYAYAAWVTGLVSAFTDDIQAAERLEAAVAGFVACGLPIEEARTRLSLARVLASSKPTVAVAEAAAPARRPQLKPGADRDGS